MNRASSPLDLKSTYRRVPGASIQSQHIDAFQAPHRFRCEHGFTLIESKTFKLNVSANESAGSDRFANAQWDSQTPKWRNRPSGLNQSNQRSVKGKRHRCSILNYVLPYVPYPWSVPLSFPALVCPCIFLMDPNGGEVRSDQALPRFPLFEYGYVRSYTTQVWLHKMKHGNFLCG